MNATAQKNELIFGYSSGKLGEAKSLFVSMYLFLNSVAAKKASIFDNFLADNLNDLDEVAPKKLNYKDCITESYKENLEYTERGITNAFLSGLHSFDQGNFKIDWVISPTFAKIHDKDFRVVSFQDEDGVYSYKENTEPKRIWRTNDESNYVSKLNFSKKYILFDNPALTKFGFYASKKERDFTIHQFSVSSTYTSFDDWSNYNGEANNIFLESNLWNSNSKAGTYINAQASIKQDANIFNSKQFNFAGYVSNEFKINSRLRTILGGRFEKYSVRYTGSSVSLNINFSPKYFILCSSNFSNIENFSFQSAA